MSSISSLQLTTAVSGETTYTSPITDLLRYNSLSYSAFYTHASLTICNLKIYFSNTTTEQDFKLYSTITLDNEVRATGNLLIPSRYVKFSVENQAPDAMENIDVVFTAFKTATSNIDVNLDSDDITTSGIATEATLELVKDNLDDIKLNTDKLPRVGDVIYENATVLAKTSTTAIDMGDYNLIQVSGRVPYESTYNFVLQFGRQVSGNYFSDNIEPDIKRLSDTPYSTFSLTRTNVAHQFVRLYNLVGGSEVFVEYDLLKN